MAKRKKMAPPPAFGTNRRRLPQRDPSRWGSNRQPADFTRKTVVELKTLAKVRGFRGYSRLLHDALVELLRR